ncbi:MAG: VIT domain-containing protein [Gemmatimonadota bacterium]
MNATLLDAAAPSAPPAGLVSVDGRRYPLASAEVQARAEGGLALTTLRQFFRNPWREPLEVLYTLPLPADGAVLGYEIQVGDRRIVGEIQTREAAAEAYREALYEGRTAGLLEQDRDDTFQQRLGNIPGETPVEVEIRVLHPLGFLEGESARWAYRFPTTVGVRYMGAPGRVADRERLEPDRAAEGLPARLALELEFPEAPVGETVHSSSHRIEAREEGSEKDGDGGRMTRVMFQEESRLDRDVVVTWPALEPDAAIRIVEGSGLEGDDGRYALLTLLPPAHPVATFRRDLTLLLDASGSMHGIPLALAGEIAAEAIRGLDEGDRFELLVFSHQVRSLTGGLVQAQPGAVRAALEALGKVEASGGTEMVGALREALRHLRKDGQHQVILLTDGYIGFEDEVVAEVARGLPPGVRIHTVGVGSAPNRTLTRGLARAGRGRELLAGDEASGREAARLLRNATARPVLTDLRVSGSAVNAVAPERTLDVLAGQPALLTLELAPEGGALEVSAARAGSGGRWRWQAAVPGRTERSVVREAPEAGRRPTSDGPLPLTRLPLGALHGRERVADLELEIAGGAPQVRIDDAIQAAGLRHRIVSRLTSLVAVAEEPSVDPLEPRRRERLAVELPAGVSAEGVGLMGRGVMRESTVLFSRMSQVFDRAGEPAVEEPVAMELAADRVGLPRLRISDAEVLHRTPELLVVEFEVPEDGFTFPVGPVWVELEDGARIAADVDPSVSTPSRRYDRGVRIRLGLLRTDGAPWPVAHRVSLGWRG